MELSNLIAIVVATASFLLSAASLVWVGGFRFSALIHEVKGVKDQIDEMKKQFEKVDAKFEKYDAKFEAVYGKIEITKSELQKELHQVDVRVTVVEQEIKKP